MFTTKAGLDIEIRRPSVKDLVDSGIGPLMAAVVPKHQEMIAKVLGRSHRNPIKPEDIGLDDVVDRSAAFCARVMTDPKLYLGSADCPEDAVTVAELGDDLFEVMFAAMEFYSEGIKEAAESAGTFRVDADGASGEPGGATVPDPTVQDPPVIVG